MTGGDLPAKPGMPVFGLRMSDGIPVLHAVLHNLHSIRCGPIYICDPNPIIELCRSLRESGQSESLVIVTWLDGSPAAIIQSPRVACEALIPSVIRPEIRKNRVKISAKT